ncbi:3126_t:CDS:2 [Dentiscutata erythropus]|uniref:3126_t:CDS:1 n=1 Tax=Dentiscutata erythropus TaxID=1348616 RepID=A0A9N9EU17_9GLOM|nr:3126_t:CDS:2 [Dentiscutata erythropus]
MGKSREAPAQFKLKDTIAQLTEELRQLNILEQGGMITNIDKEKKTIQCEIRLSTKALHKLEYQKQFQQKYRKQKKQKLLQIERQFKEAGLDMQLVRPTVGHPSLEEQQPGLLEAIVQIVSPDGQADERWRSEIVWSVKTLDQLQEALTNMNYKLSHSATYLRLIPRRHNSEEGNAALIRNMKEMVSLLGPKSALVISQDDKARIPFGLAMANKQEYRVKLPDHDWVVAERHKLIPSVYAILDVKEDKYRQAEAVTYSGPIFIRIRSNKHNSSTVYSHSKDFNDLMNEKKLHNYTTTINEQPKPVVVLLSNSSPDENPRYRKTVQMIIEHFDKYDLDTIIVACFAPHQNASNPVERTNNEELEKRNFKAAGDILTSIWENTIIDNYPVLVKYIDPSDELYSPSEKSTTWIENHNQANSPESVFPSTTCGPANALWYLQPALDSQEFPVVYIHNYQYDEFLVSNENSETMWVEEEMVPEDALKTYNQQVQVQEELIADKVLIINWDT